MCIYILHTCVMVYWHNTLIFAADIDMFTSFSLLKNKALMLYIRRCTALSPCLGAVVDIKDRATPQYRLTKTFTWLQLWRCFFIFFYFLFFSIFSLGRNLDSASRHQTSLGFWNQPLSMQWINNTQGHEWNKKLDSHPTWQRNRSKLQRSMVLIKCLV